MTQKFLLSQFIDFNLKQYLSKLDPQKYKIFKLIRLQDF